MERWNDRVALVTGASSGIGAAVARRLLDEGMRVVACARRIHRVREIGADMPDRFFAVRTDLREEADILVLFEAAATRFGGVDVLVNNAGLGHAAPLVSGDTEKWREMLDLNVLALSICTREALQDMLRRGVDDGHIVHISSMAGHRVPPGSGMYAASKHAVRALTEALRKELRFHGSHVRVTAISPGLVETEFAAHYHGKPEAAEQAYGRYPVLTPADVAEAVRYVLAAPPHVQVHDILVRPTQQES